jgi:hypothetical protein
MKRAEISKAGLPDHQNEDQSSNLTNLTVSFIEEGYIPKNAQRLAAVCKEEINQLLDRNELGDDEIEVLLELNKYNEVPRTKGVIAKTPAESQIIGEKINKKMFSAQDEINRNL